MAASSVFVGQMAGSIARRAGAAGSLKKVGEGKPVQSVQPPKVAAKRSGADDVVALIRLAKRSEVKPFDHPGVFLFAKLKVDGEMLTFAQLFDRYFGTTSEERRVMLDTLKEQGVLHVSPCRGGIMITVQADYEAARAKRDAAKTEKPKGPQIDKARIAALLG